jgi:hypothetical protein
VKQVTNNWNVTAMTIIVLLLLLPRLQVRSGLRHLTLEALAEATPLGQRAAALREASKVRAVVHLLQKHFVNITAECCEQLSRGRHLR